jgi:DNA recombination protein RmuC
MATVLIAAVVGLVVGLGVAVAVGRAAREASPAGPPTDTDALLLAQLEALRQQLAASQAEQLQGSIDALVKVASEKFTDQSSAASRELDLRHQSISQQFSDVTSELTRMRELVGQLQRERAEQHGQIAQGLQHAISTTQALSDTTQNLREALANSKTRGQWGERMAEDVLAMAGFVEGINYRKQTAIAGGGIPDFTFLLPRGRVMHMDVKFPLDNFLRAEQATDTVEVERFRTAFLKDVRQRVKEIGGRNYIDPDETVEAVVLFIPNESIYGFIHQHDPRLADAALQQKVVLCSPFTLFAVLAVVRQAVDAFTLERTSDEILSCLTGFHAQWSKFSDELDKVGRRFESTQKAFDELAGPRRRQMQRTLDQVDELRHRRGLPEPLVARGPRVDAEEQAPEEADDVEPSPSGGPAEPDLPRLRPVRLG